MIKIAYLIDTIQSPTAGTENQLLLLLKHIDRKEFQPYLCVLRSSDWLERSFDLCPLQDLGWQSFKSIGSYRNILRYSRFLRRERVDVLQSFFRDGNKVAFLAAVLAGTRFFISSRRNLGYWLNRRELLALRLLNRHVDLFIANSMRAKENLIEMEKVPDERIRVIYNGVDLDGFNYDRESTREYYRLKLGIPPEALVIGIVANLRPPKSVDVFIRAARIVHDHIPNTRFLVIGHGPRLEPLKQLANDLGLDEVLTFLGKREDVREILSAFDLAVLSSSSESFSNSILEYMAAGLPVVCTDVGDCAEAVVDRETGFVVPPDDFQSLAEAMQRIMVQNLFASMAIQARRRVEQSFSLENMIRRHEEIYRSLFGFENMPAGKARTILSERKRT